MRRIVLALVAVASVLMASAGCAGGSDDDPTALAGVPSTIAVDSLRTPAYCDRRAAIDVGVDIDVRIDRDDGHQPADTCARTATATTTARAARAGRTAT